MSHPILKEIDKDHASSYSIVRMLKKHGFKLFGKGAYTATYGKDDLPFVIKVNAFPDPAAFKFYSMIEKHKSKYFPKVHKLRSYVNKDGAFLFVVAVERLHPLTYTTWKQANEDAIGFASWLNSKNDAEISYVEESGIDYVKLGKKWKKTNSSTFTLVKHIIKQTNNYSETDMYDGNIMVRLPKGDIVLNDPVCTI